MKKILSFLLCVCLLLSLVACNNGDKEKETNAPENETEEPSYLDTLPKVNLEGEEFKILIGTQVQHFYDFDNPSANVVENAAYMRNLEIEEYYNTDIVYHALDGNASGSQAFSAAITNSLMSAPADAFDLVLGQNYMTLNLMSSGAWHNLKEAEVTNWDAEWYHHAINENGTINGRLYGASGSFVISNMAWAMAWYYNKGVYERYGFEEDIYQLVRDGKWTYEKFYEMVSKFDAVSNAEDLNAAVWGFMWFDHAISGIAVGMGLTFGEKDGDGVWNFDNFYNDRTEDIYSKLYDLFITQQGGATNDASAMELDSGSGFDHYLFASNYTDGLFHLDWLAKREGLSVGVILPPKYDEKQADYYVHVMRNDLYLIPTNSDLEKTATLVEALNYKTLEIVYPEYWDKAIELRSADTSEDHEMLQLMAQKLTFSFGSYFRQDLLAIDTAFRDQIGVNKSPTFSTWWGSNSFTLGLKLEILYEIYGGIVAEE